MTFTSQHIFTFFRRSLAQNSLYHTFLFVGCSRQLPIEVAGLLLCRDAGSKFANAPCQQCSSCTKVAATIHPDVFCVDSGAKSSISVEQVREVSKEARIKPWEGRYKVFVLRDVQRMREEAANALLKILEEPPAQTIFLLTSANEHQVIPTIISRCQVFHVGKNLPNLVETLLIHYKIPKTQAKMLAELGISNTNEDWEVIKKQLQDRENLFAKISKASDPIQAAEEIADICGSGEQARQYSSLLIDYTASFWRDVFIIKSIADSSRFVVNCDSQEQLRGVAQMCNADQILQFLEFLAFQAKTMIVYNVSLALLWENVFFAVRNLLHQSYNFDIRRIKNVR